MWDSFYFVGVDEFLELEPAVRQAIRIRHLAVAHAAHRINVPLHALLLEFGNRILISVEREDLLDHVIIDAVLLQEHSCLCFLNSQSFFLCVTLHESTPDEFASIEVFNRLGKFCNCVESLRL